MVTTSSGPSSESAQDTVAAETRTTWMLDPAHTVIQFAIKHMMISTVRGGFSAVSGTIAWDHEDLTRSTVEASVDTRTIDTHAADRDHHLRGADFLDVEAYPEITFKSTHIAVTGLEQLRITGDLTVHGVTREVVLAAELGGRQMSPWGQEKMGFAATTQIKRKDFGLTWNMALEMGGMMVGEEVKISIDGEATRQ